jgi:hypothetical protein
MTVPDKIGGRLSDLREIKERLRAGLDEALLSSKKVLGRIAHQGQLWRQHESAPTKAAWARKRRPSVSTFWANPPTTAFIWAKASRSVPRREPTGDFDGNVSGENVHTRLTETGG